MALSTLTAQLRAYPIEVYIKRSRFGCYFIASFEKRYSNVRDLALQFHPFIYLPLLWFGPQIQLTKDVNLPDTVMLPRVRV